jgi:hypothetical protein
MKTIKPVISFYILITILFTSCAHWDDHNINISVKEQREVYQFYASYSRYKTADVEYYINKHIGSKEYYVSNDRHADVYTELDDGTKFHIKSSPGRLKIQFNKRENSEAAYRKIKSICEGLKDVLTESKNN